MAKAKTLTSEQFNTVLSKVISQSPNPLRDAAALLLSFRAGLRSVEIAGLSWRNVLTADGRISDTIEIPPGIAKKGAGGTVPMHPELAAVLQQMLDTFPKEHLRASMPIVRGLKADVRMNPNALQMWFRRTFEKCGLIGVSSHSGRRTFLTTLAQTANQFGCSIYDVQRIARHADVSTTETYIEASAGVGNMVRAVR